MVLKEDWTSQDRFNYNNINDIYNIVNIIEEKLSINSPFQKTIKRNIQVGDDLSGKTIYFEFPDDFYDSILNDVAGGQSNVITTSSHSILEYSNIYNSVATVSKDSWMNTIYYANTDTAEVYSNLTEITLESDWGKVTSINENLSAYNYIYIYETEIIKKNHGDFLYAEDLQRIEDNIEIIAQCVNTSFKKRNWYCLSVITYEDINRWSIILNYAYEIIFEDSTNIVTEDEELLITEDDYYIMTEGG